MEVQILGTPNIIPINEAFNINQNDKVYKLEIKIENETLVMSIYEKELSNKSYYLKMTIKEIKNIHQIFCIFNSCEEFLDYIKVLLKNEKFLIKNENKKLSIILNIEYLFKQQSIEIPLFEKKLKLKILLMIFAKKYQF